MTIQIQHAKQHIRNQCQHHPKTQLFGSSGGHTLVSLAQDENSCYAVQRLVPYLSRRAAALVARQALPALAVLATEQRGKYLLKTGQRPGLPLALQLTPTEQQLYDTDTRIRRVS